MTQRMSNLYSDSVKTEESNRYSHPVFFVGGFVFGRKKRFMFEDLLVQVRVFLIELF